jgi:hypothetical protein
VVSACCCGVYNHRTGDVYAVWILLGRGGDGVEARLQPRSHDAEESTYKHQIKNVMHLSQSTPEDGLCKDGICKDSLCMHQPEECSVRVANCCCLSLTDIKTVGARTIGCNFCNPYQRYAKML